MYPRPKALPLSVAVALLAAAGPSPGEAPADPATPAVGAHFVEPLSPRAVYDFNPDWRFSFGDAEGAEKADFDDSTWGRVSLPHTWNETDTYRAFISHSGGDQSEGRFGIGWYRKHFRLPAGADGGHQIPVSRAGILKHA
jgi:hypothetical protein